MLGLKLPTDPRWAEIAEKSIAEILVDHAFCEQKAASSCISLIVHYPDYPRIVQELSPIVTEEWGHFRVVLEEMSKRDIALGPQRSDEYVVALLAFQPRGLSREQKLLERLLCCALIEARSCERFRLLSLHCSDADLRRFYHAFMVSEAGHYRLFMDLAEGYFPKDKVRNRWEAYLQYEAGVMEQFSNRSGRIH
ncbi:MAG: tRNA-(ms[2]io[6]A)-hydroxylase [Sphingomonadales bacterium]|nr:tRNA-(ms[2]io[6]A)-hydroxylase [Sphingomonadales bacterium]MBM3924009.1 tRNA-(ms[2]io[6]A)-hydroxylase [Sphingomonadales bacterium]MBM3931521.1 tRNA-(ms[2]io[6]A)-hydroxylase [Sphingomonadales bacterium]